MDIKLNLINRSNDTNNSKVVIFQKNAALIGEGPPIAWTVIQNCGPGDRHPFSFPDDLSLSTTDEYGNATPPLSAINGQLYRVGSTASGHSLESAGAATTSSEIQLSNDLQIGAVNAGIYKSGKLLAAKTPVAPGQQAIFEFKPTIWVGAVSQLEEGQVLNSAIISDVNTELSLLGVASADIVMTGGGPGPASTPFQFNLENVVKA